MSKNGKDGSSSGGIPISAEEQKNLEESQLYLQEEFGAVDNTPRHYSRDLKQALGSITDKDSEAYAIIDQFADGLVSNVNIPDLYIVIAKEFLVAINESQGDTKVLDTKLDEIDARYAEDLEEEKQAREKESKELSEAQSRFNAAFGQIDTNYIIKDVIEEKSKEAVGLFIKYDYSKKDALNIVTSAITQMNEEVAKTQDGEKGSKVFGDAIYEAGKRAVTLYKSRQETIEKGFS